MRASLGSVGREDPTEEGTKFSIEEDKERAKTHSFGPEEALAPTNIVPAIMWDEGELQQNPRDQEGTDGL